MSPCNGLIRVVAKTESWHEVKIEVFYFLLVGGK